MECNTFKKIEEGGVMATVYTCIWKVSGLNVGQGCRYWCTGGTGTDILNVIDYPVTFLWNVD